MVVAALLLVSIGIFLFTWRMLNSIERDLEVAKRKHKSEPCFKSLSDADNAEDIERKIDRSIMRLQELVDERYSKEGIKSHTGLQQHLEEATKDDEFAENLLESMNYLEDKTSKEELTETDKRVARQAAFSVLRQTPRNR